jgi:hypothetical protein
MAEKEGLWGWTCMGGRRVDEGHAVAGYGAGLVLASLAPIAIQVNSDTGQGAY